MNQSIIRSLLILFVVMAGAFIPQSIVAQTLKGRVIDAITGETLIGAAVRVVELPLTGVATNVDGEYSITLAQSGRYTIETSYVGYEPSVMKEVAGGHISPFNNLEKIKAQKCNSYKIKECFESGFCVWKNGKCVLKKQSL